MGQHKINCLKQRNRLAKADFSPVIATGSASCTHAYTAALIVIKSHSTLESNRPL